MARKNGSPQKAAMRGMMRSYFKENDISIKKRGNISTTGICYEPILHYLMAESSKNEYRQ